MVPLLEVAIIKCFVCEFRIYMYILLSKSLLVYPRKFTSNIFHV